jgi:GNAT superfamily N-acetyltransferase
MMHAHDTVELPASAAPPLAAVPRDLEFTVLRDAEQGGVFRMQTFPAFRGWLDFEAAGTVPVAIGASQQGATVGLALAVPDAGGLRCNLLSLYVDPSKRGQGIATSLLARLEEECLARGLRTLWGNYMTGQPTTPALERVLVKCGFPQPEGSMLVVKCSADSVKDAPWAQLRAMPAEYEIVRWVDVSAGEREHIRESNARKSWIASDLIPFNFESGIEPATSLALRYRGEIVGWCLTHVVGGVLRFTCAYVRPDLARMARLVHLIGEAVARAPAIGVTEGMWTTPFSHPSMVRFVRRWMQPYATFCGETRNVEKRLAAEPG